MHFAVVAPVLHTYYTTHGMSTVLRNMYVPQKVLYILQWFQYITSQVKMFGPLIQKILLGQ